MVRICIKTNPWCLPSAPMYIEGSPTAEQAEREAEQARAARAAWKPSPDAWALLERLRAAIGCQVVVHAWDPIMFWIAEEGPYPMRGRCVDVVVRLRDDLERAYLVLDDIEAIRTPHGFDGRRRFVSREEAGVFVDVGELVEVEFGAGLATARDT